jgi:hypothetical protein
MVTWFVGGELNNLWKFPWRWRFSALQRCEVRLMFTDVSEMLAISIDSPQFLRTVLKHCRYFSQGLTKTTELSQESWNRKASHSIAQQHWVVSSLPTAEGRDRTPNWAVIVSFLVLSCLSYTIILFSLLISNNEDSSGMNDFRLKLKNKASPKHGVSRTASKLR